MCYIYSSCTFLGRGCVEIVLVARRVKSLSAHVHASEGKRRDKILGESEPHGCCARRLWRVCELAPIALITIHGLGVALLMPCDMDLLR